VQIELTASASVAPGLARLREVLWSDDAEVVLTRGAPRRRAPGREWRLLPSAASPTLLVPPRGRAGASVLYQFNDSMRYRTRLMKAAAAFALRAGLGAVLVPGRVAVTAGERDVARDLIESELPRILGVPRVEVAISLGAALRANMKPILHIMSPDGEILAFGKLGWNALTSDLVDHEASTLRRLEPRSFATFRAPRVIHHQRWNGSSLVLLTPLRQTIRRRRRSDELPPLDVLRELASVRPDPPVAFTEGAFWRDLTGRARAAAGPLADGDGLERAIARLTSRAADEALVPAFSHGDFAPWNMLHARDTLHLWDWERASETRPLGFDALHFHFEVAYQRRRLDPAGAMEFALEMSRPAMRELGVGDGAIAATRDVYVLGRATRLLEGLGADVPVDERLLAWLVTSLRDGG
jgi:hypothetical protein